MAIFLASFYSRHVEYTCRDYFPCTNNNLLINVDKTKVMASDGIACRILIQNEQLEQVDTFPYLGSLITKKWWVYDGIPYQVKQRAGDRGHTNDTKV